MLQESFRKWVADLPSRCKLSLRSIEGVKLTPAILRRSAMQWHGFIAPLEMVSRLANHRSTDTTRTFYLSMDSEDLFAVRSSHAQRLLEE